MANSAANAPRGNSSRRVMPECQSVKAAVLRTFCDSLSIRLDVGGQSGPAAARRRAVWGSRRWLRREDPAAAAAMPRVCGPVYPFRPHIATGLFHDLGSLVFILRHQRPKIMLATPR